MWGRYDGMSDSRDGGRAARGVSILRGAAQRGEGGDG